MKNLINLVLIVILVAFTSTFAQKEEVKKEPGYIEFGNLSSLETGDMVAEVLLENNILKLVSKFAKEDEPELSDLLAGIKLIKVNVFEVNDQNEDEIAKKIKGIEKDLAGKNWERIVRVRDKSESANVYIKTQNDDSIVGLLVMAMDSEGEAAFVNIVGNINLETIGKLGEKFDIPSLDKINKK